MKYRLREDLAPAAQVVDGSQSSVDGTVVADRISAIIVARSDGEQWHQMQIGEAQLFEVTNVLARLVQVLAEQVNVQCTADDLLRLKPIRLVAPMAILGTQFVGTRDPGLRR